MKLVIKNKENLRSLFSREEGPDVHEERLEKYDLNQLEKWEQGYQEILQLLEGAEKKEGMKLLFSLAEEGYPEARWLLSDMYLQGENLPESLPKAWEWERRARYAEKFFLAKRL